MTTDQLTLSPAVPFSQAFGASTLGFGTPPGSQTDIFRGALFSTDDMDGPSASRLRRHLQHRSLGRHQRHDARLDRHGQHQLLKAPGGAGGPQS
jgi:hypothetical protein